MVTRFTSIATNQSTDGRKPMINPSLYP